MTIGERIRKARKEAGLTQAQLAEILGISYVGVSQWESGKRNPKFETLEKIASALHVQIVDLLPERSKEDVLDMVEYMQKNSPNVDTEDVREYFTRQAIEMIPLDEIDAAIEESDLVLVKGFQNLPDSYLLKLILEAFSTFNRRGKIEAFIRVQELADSAEYRFRNRIPLDEE